MVAKAHFIIGEELMVVKRVPLIDRAQSFYIDGPVHDVLVHSPLKDIRKQEGQRDRQPLKPRYVVNVRDIHVERRGAHGVDDRDMKITIVPTNDAGAVFLPKIDLPLTDHVALLDALRRVTGSPAPRMI
jgi:hypothetical protein